MQHLYTVPHPRVIARPRLDAEGKHVLDEAGKIVVDVDQVVDALLGLDLALQSVTSGPKLFEVWALRKKIKEAMAPQAFDSAKYLLLDDTEKEVLLQGAKTIDWTFQQKLTFWVEWEQFFSALSDIQVYDEKNPPAAYVSWRRADDAKRAAAAEEKAEIERRVLADKEAAADKRTKEIAESVGKALESALAAKIAEGVLGAAATVDDLPSGLVNSIWTRVTSEYDAE